METEIFTCKYFKFGRNTTGLSQSHLRNFLACSITELIIYMKKLLDFDWLRAVQFFLNTVQKRGN